VKDNYKVNFPYIFSALADPLQSAAGRVSIDMRGLRSRRSTAGDWPATGDAFMRRVLSLGLVMAVACVGMPVGAYAATKAPAALAHRSSPKASEGVRQGQGTGSLNGVAQGADKAPLRNYTVRLRDVTDGGIAGTTTSSGAGEFTFTGLWPGNYVVEVVDAAGQVVGLSPTLGITAGSAMTVTINAAAGGALTAAAASSGFSLFGLGTIGSVAVITAAGVAGVTAVVATRGDASPSR
jgi:Carboxypeptidase regulatory-like domain